jgi:repressor LexA
MVMFGSRIKELRKRKNISQKEMADALNVAQSTVGNWEGGIREPSFEMLQNIASFFSVSIDYLINKETPSMSEEGAFITYPVVVGVKAGYDGEVIFEESGDSEQIPTEWLKGDSPSNFFVARVHGDSMYPLFLEGDRVLVHITPSVDSGSIAVMRYNETELTLKRVIYRPGEDWFELQPINTSYPPKRVEGADLKNCGVIGEVKKLIRAL